MLCYEILWDLEGDPLWAALFHIRGGQDSSEHVGESRRGMRAYERTALTSYESGGSFRTVSGPDGGVDGGLDRGIGSVLR